MSNPQIVLENGVEVKSKNQVERTNRKRTVFPFRQRWLKMKMWKNPLLLRLFKRVNVSLRRFNCPLIDQIVSIEMSIHKRKHCSLFFDQQQFNKHSVIRWLMFEFWCKWVKIFRLLIDKKKGRHLQLGFEPLPSVRGRNIFGKEVLFYPNVLRYRKSKKKKNPIEKSIETSIVDFSSIHFSKRRSSRSLSRFWFVSCFESRQLVRDDNSRRSTFVFGWEMFDNRSFFLQLFERPNVRSGNENEQPTWNSFIQKVTTKKKRSFWRQIRFVVEFKRSSMSIVGNSYFTSFSR